MRPEHNAIDKLAGSGRLRKSRGPSAVSLATVALGPGRKKPMSVASAFPVDCTTNAQKCHTSTTPPPPHHPGLHVNAWALSSRERARCLSSVPNLNKSICPPPEQAGFEFYANGIVKLRRLGAGNPEPPHNPRQKITELTNKSRTAMLVKVAASGIAWRSMLVLTYGQTFPGSGKMVKRNLNTLLTALRRLGYTTYFWFLEFQARGAPHVHILLSEPPNVAHRDKIAKTWVKTLRKHLGVSEAELRRVYRVHNHAKTWQAESKPGGLLRYAAKYATKTWQKDVPEAFQDVGRWWGCSRDVTPRKLGEMPIEGGQAQARLLLDALEHRCADWQQLPTWLFGIEFEDLA